MSTAWREKWSVFRSFPRRSLFSPPSSARSTRLPPHCLLLLSLCRHFDFPPPPHPTFDLESLIRTALDEDAGLLGDLTTQATISPSTQAEATFLAKDSGILAGLGVATAVFQTVDPSCTVTWSVREGDRVEHGQKFGLVRGPARAVLIGERVALNLLQRMSGIATLTRRMVDACHPHRAKILETRKTVPGLRLVDKWAVLIGGGRNHRMGLYDMMMIKDNHIAAAGGIVPAMERCDAFLREGGDKRANVTIEVETRNEEELNAVLQYLDAHVDVNVNSPFSTRVRRIMLDNRTRRDPSAPGGIDVSLLARDVERIAGRVECEASGNVTLETVSKIAATGVDYISSGQLTHSVRVMDISLNIETLPGS